MKHFLTVLIIIFSNLLSGILNEAKSQAPQTFPYQAVARDANGSLLSNQNISLRLSILDVSNIGTIVYQETQNVNTNTLGLFTINIGQGTIQSGTFPSINWGVGSKFIKVEMDVTGDTNYVTMGTSQLLSVPYAMYAENANVPGVAGTVGATGSQGPIGLTGAQGPIGLTGAQGPIGLTGATGAQGPIGLTGAQGPIGLTGAQGPIGLTGATGPAGAANISGTTNRLIKFTDSTTGGNSDIYEDITGNIGIGTTTPVAKLDINATGNNVAQFNGTSQMYLSLFENGVYRGYLGSYSGANEDVDFGTGVGNTLGKLNLTIKSIPQLTINHIGNVGIGTTSPSTKLDVNGQVRIQGGTPGVGKLLMSDATGLGTWTTFNEEDPNAWSKTGNAGTNPTSNYIGTNDNQSLKLKVNNTQVGLFKTDGNIYLGLNSGVSAISASRNVAVGVATLYNNATGDNQIAIGDSTLYNNTFGTNNVGMGYKSLYENTAGSSNSAVGYKTLSKNTVGQGSTALGYNALSANTTGDYNVGIGYSTLSANTTGDNNVGIGYNALSANKTGNDNIAMGAYTLFNSVANSNIAIGRAALYNDSNGYSNIAIGRAALYNNISENYLVAIGDSTLFNNASGNNNTAIGTKSLYSNTTGDENTANGSLSLFSNLTGSRNLATGMYSLYSNITGTNNVANGYQTLYMNTGGGSNTASGYKALRSNIGGDCNTATGSESLYSNTIGYQNTAVGCAALYSNTGGSLNVGIGHNALVNNLTGYNNVTVGVSTMFNNSVGDENTALGNYSLQFNTTSSGNTATGFKALQSNNVGNYNTANGYQALHGNTNGTYNTAVGYEAGAAHSSNDYCTFLGYDADQSVVPDVINSMALGRSSRVTASNQVRIGNSSISSIGGYESWSDLSDGRFKKDIKEDVKGLAFITQLRPVTYHLDVRKLNQFINQNDTVGHDEKAIVAKEATVRSGFIAQEVEAAAKEIGYDFNGVDKPQSENDHYGLRYAEFVVPLVKGMQEQQVIIDDLQQQVEAVKSEIPIQIGKQQVEIEELKIQNELLLKRLDALEKK